MDFTHPNINKWIKKKLYALNLKSVSASTVAAFVPDDKHLQQRLNYHCSTQHGSEKTLEGLIWTYLGLTQNPKF